MKQVIKLNPDDELEVYARGDKTDTFIGIVHYGGIVSPDSSSVKPVVVVPSRPVKPKVNVKRKR